MNKKIGRPTADPKNKFLKIRVSETDLYKIKYVSETLNISQTDVLRRGVDNQYDEIKGIKK